MLDRAWPDYGDPSSGGAFPEAKMSILGPLPAIGVVTDLGLERFRFGVGFAVPVAEASAWQARYEGRPGATRYHGLGGRLAQLMIEPAVAFRVNRYLSIGAGVDVIGLWVSSELMVDFGAKVNQAACAANPSGTGCQADAA